MNWVVFYGEDWGRHKSTGQYLAAELAKLGYQLIWVNSLGLRTPGFNISDITRIFTKIGQFSLGLFRHDERQDDTPNNINVITPIAIPLLKYRAVRILNRFILSRYLNAHFRRLKVSSPIVITSCVSTVDIIDKFNPKTRIYYCADEYATLPGMDYELVRNLERELISKVDMVVVSSKALLQSKKALHGNIRYLPHGVNFELFHKALIEEQEMPSDLKNINGVKIGFVGLLGEHIDFEIIDYLAASRPDINLVLIGPVESGVTVPKRDNIHLLGKKSPDQVPSYLQHFDVCIIPYKQNERIDYVNPTKLREYLAAGCQVVSTPQKEAELMGVPVSFAGTKQEFLQKIDILLLNVKDVDRLGLSNKMREHDWALRAADFDTMIKELCGGNSKISDRAI